MVEFEVLLEALNLTRPYTQTTKTNRRNSVDLAARDHYCCPPGWACSGGKFVVSSAEEAYDALESGPSEIPAHLILGPPW